MPFQTFLQPGRAEGDDPGRFAGHGSRQQRRCALCRSIFWDALVGAGGRSHYSTTKRVASKALLRAAAYGISLADRDSFRYGGAPADLLGLGA
jgi:hypothetical protein